MTLNAITLDDYFKLIIKPTDTKETTMFDVMKEATASVKAKWTEFMNDSFKFVDVTDKYEQLDDYWSFELRSSAYESDGEVVPAQHDFILDTNDATWMDVVDRVLDVLGKHYCYNIKEQVYYSVAYPLNHPDSAGYGRELNDEVLQKLLLSFPEVYERTGHIEA